MTKLKMLDQQYTDAVDETITLKAENARLLTQVETLRKALEGLNDLARRLERALASISGLTPQSIAKFLADIDSVEGAGL